ncbi:hypothetical protein ABIF38_006651 [Bradyrhizobium japonicum]|jgi:hypothetical protein|uniref:Uncharacterized protein n=1 Tax=Bradyrhizobium elkanii TaxID=29448 RepID=A0A1E3EKF2_BRAEL|nr:MULTISPECIES: hypothetical protein [Bradyrhizobium]MBP1297688.1 hypothetical protein [Bradyrhizobium elkanii]MCP1731041.1 hypothetical protein [Bradyrhizobium elkanii]MCP1758016.1 hypothetical protein [Bradyrhizobium elkanii]MCP1931595.1 hypothetical protein [Bradyrhizobium elkanii]MCP1969922.1 hypothetical protein [Bradyrhizobium elkanii]
MYGTAQANRSFPDWSIRANVRSRGPPRIGSSSIKRRALCLHRKRINISTMLAGQQLGIKEVDDGIWLASFMHDGLGYFDLEQKTLQPLDNPFGTRLSPMS